MYSGRYTYYFCSICNCVHIMFLRQLKLYLIKLNKNSAGEMFLKHIHRNNFLSQLILISYEIIHNVVEVRHYSSKKSSALETELLLYWYLQFLG